MTTIGFDPPAPLLSMNDRHHWRKRAQLVKAWRTMARFAAHGMAPVGPSTVAVTLPVRDKRRRDPHNYYPTVKAIVDGLVDAGLWPDDTPEWVHTVEPVLHVGGRVVVAIIERGDAGTCAAGAHGEPPSTDRTTVRPYVDGGEPPRTCRTDARLADPSLHHDGALVVGADGPHAAATGADGATAVGGRASRWPSPTPGRAPNASPNSSTGTASWTCPTHPKESSEHLPLSPVTWW